MEFTNEFYVPADIDTAFATLTDLEKVAPCLPGAHLEEAEGDTYRGRCKVKVGPIQVIYRGEAHLAEADRSARTLRIEAKGQETRGSGSARADIAARLTESGQGTQVEVVTTLDITGRPAQFGRGVMAEVGSQIIDAFAHRLRAMLESGEATPAATTPPADGAAPDAGQTRRIASDVEREDDALDLGNLAGAATIKRVVPLLAAVTALLGLMWWLRGRSDRRGSDRPDHG